MSFASRQLTTTTPGTLRTAAPSGGAGSGRKVKPVVGRVIHTLRGAVEQLQRDSEQQIALEHESAQTFAFLCQQVAALQRGFTTLADAVLEELDAVRDESVRWQDEREAWAASMKELAGETRRKLQELDRWQAESVAVKADQLAARNDLELHKQQLAELDSRLSAFKGNMDEFRVEIGYAQSAVAEVRAGLGEADRRDTEQSRAIGGLSERLDTAVSAITEDLGTLWHEASEQAAALGRDSRVLVDDLRALRTWCKHFETAHDLRLKKVEAGAQLDVLQKKLGALSQQQARHAKSVEEVVKSLLADTGALTRAARQTDASVGNLRRCAVEQHEALVRSSRAFADALHMQTPVPAASSLASSLALLATTATSDPLPTKP